MAKNYLGEFEELILLAVLKLGENEAYGLSIAETIEEATDRRVSIGALYTALGRMEEKGFIRSSIGESTQERGGRPKKLYIVDSAGLEMLKNASNARKLLSVDKTVPLTL